MTSDEGIRAHLDLQGGEPTGAMLPIHWATFSLAPHPWAEPGEWTMRASRKAGIAMAAPGRANPSSPLGSPRSIPGGERSLAECFRRRGMLRCPVRSTGRWQGAWPPLPGDERRCQCP